MKGSTADSVTLEWNRYDDAEGYIVYGSLCNGNGKKYKLKKLAVINDPETTEFTVTGLEEGRHYKFRVKAFKVVDGKKYVTVKTYLVHATTAGGKCKTTAAVDIDQTGMKKADALTLKAGRTYDIKAVRYDAKGSKVRHSGIKYQSTNPEIATVSLKTGKITAVGKGKCSVFVIAENGLCEEIKVTVK